MQDWVFRLGLGPYYYHDYYRDPGWSAKFETDYEVSRWILPANFAFGRIIPHLTLAADSEGWSLKNIEIDQNNHQSELSRSIWNFLVKKLVVFSIVLF